MAILRKIPKGTKKKLYAKGYFPQDGYIIQCLPVPPNCLSVPDISDGISTMSTVSHFIKPSSVSIFLSYQYATAWLISLIPGPFYSIAKKGVEASGDNKKLKVWEAKFWISWNRSQWFTSVCHSVSSIQGYWQGTCCFLCAVLIFGGRFRSLFSYLACVTVAIFYFFSYSV